MHVYKWISIRTLGSTWSRKPSYQGESTAWKGVGPGLCCPRPSTVTWGSGKCPVFCFILRLRRWWYTCAGTTPSKPWRSCSLSCSRRSQWTLWSSTVTARPSIALRPVAGPPQQPPVGRAHSLSGSQWSFVESTKRIRMCVVTSDSGVCFPLRGGLNCNSVDGPRRHYAKWNKSETNTIWSYLYVKSKNKIDRQNRTNWWLPEGSGAGWKGERIKKYKLTVLK